VDDPYLHINDPLNGDYPEPEVPVDEAWESMNCMLNVQVWPGTRPLKTFFKTNLFRKLSFILPVSGVVVYTAVVLTSPENREVSVSDLSNTIENRMDEPVRPVVEQVPANELSGMPTYQTVPVSEDQLTLLKDSVYENETVKDPTNETLPISVDTDADGAGETGLSLN
jgi:hypothetical protein